MITKLNIWDVIVWIFVVLFLVIGILNFIHIHPVPGAIYVIISIIYLPPVNKILKNTIGFMIPAVVKIILGLVILWGTLAVGDLAELYGL